MAHLRAARVAKSKHCYPGSDLSTTDGPLDGKIASASRDDLRRHAIARGDPGPRTVVQAMSSVNHGGFLTPAQIGLLVLVRIYCSEYKRICMHANMQPRIYRGTCMCTCIRTCASCGRNQAKHCLFIPSCDKLSNANMTPKMIFRGIEQAIRLHQATVLCYRTMQPCSQGSIYVVYRAMHQWSADTCICHRFLHSN